MSEWKAGAAGETEAQWRQWQSFLLAQATRGTVVTGVLGGDGLSVSQTATPSGSVQVISGAAVQQTSLTTGVNPLISNATKTVDVLGASPMGSLPRNDLIVFDAVTASIVAVIGTPNASPSDPVPANAHVKLARIRNAANATTITNASIDDLRVATTLNVPAAPSWQTYSPVYSNTLSESLSVGNGSITGRYRVSGSGAGQSCTVQVKFTRGSTTNVGTGGSWTISLPLPGDGFDAVGIGSQVIGSAKKPLLVEMVNSTTIAFDDVAGNRITPSNPGGGAAAQAGHVYQLSITYPLP